MNLQCDYVKDKYQIFYTSILFYIYFAMGITLAIPPPCYVDFTHLLNTSMSWIGFIQTFLAIGTIAGACVTIFYKWLNRQLTLVILTIGMGLSIIFMPYTTQLWQLYLCELIYATGIGGFSGAINVIIIEMWQNKSPASLQLSYFVYNLGSIAGPLITKNYVLGNMICPGVWPQKCNGYNQTLSDSTSITTTLEPNSVCTEECLHYDRRPQLKIPFLIGGLLMLIGPVLLFVMYFVKRYHYVNEVMVAVNEELEARHKQYIPKNTILIGIALYFAIGVMSESIYSEFSSTFFQYQPTLHLSAAQSSTITSTMSASEMVGRFISIFIAMYLKPQYMILAQFLIVLIGYILLIVGQDQLILLWCSVILISLGYSSIAPSMYSFVRQYTVVTDRVSGLFVGATMSIYVFLPYFIGELIPIYPSGVLYIELLCFCTGIIAFVSVLIAVRNLRSGPEISTRC